MADKEYLHIVAAILVFTAVISFYPIITSGNWAIFPQMIFFSALIVLVSVFAKKLMAYLLDSGVEHKLWFWERWGFRSHHRIQPAVPAGIILPLFFSLFSLGYLKVGTLLTYEARALKYKAAKRFGFWSYISMSEWHHALIGAAGIVCVLILGAFTYFLPFNNMEYLAKLCIYFCFWNLIPISKLDGIQIFFGSRLLWSTLAIITVILTALALMI
jgi:hypothetical protein